MFNLPTVKEAYESMRESMKVFNKDVKAATPTEPEGEEDEMKVAMIVAMDNNGVIGKGNTLPFKLENDMQHFYEKTYGKVLIMGHNTYKSLGYNLTNRVHIVIVSDLTKFEKHTENPDEVVMPVLASNTENSIIELALRMRNSKKEEVFVIGGGEVYKNYIDLVDKVYVTHFNANLTGDDLVYFPVRKLSSKEWKTKNCQRFFADADNEYDHYIWEAARL